jgi:hypothetical protein
MTLTWMKDQATGRHDLKDDAEVVGFIEQSPAKLGWFYLVGFNNSSNRGSYFSSYQAARTAAEKVYNDSLEEPE